MMNDYNDEVKIDVDMSPEFDSDSSGTNSPLRRSLSSSPDDVFYRKIQIWDSKSENFLNDVIKDIDKKIEFHRNASKKYRAFHYTFGFFSTALPLISAGLLDLFDSKLFETNLLISIGIINSVSQFFRLETMHNKHLEFEDRFEELKSKINLELTKSKANRMNCELFILKVVDKYNLLNYTGPN